MGTRGALVVAVSAILAVGCSIDAGDGSPAAEAAGPAATGTSAAPEEVAETSSGAVEPPGASGSLTPEDSAAPAPQRDRPSPWPPRLPSGVPTTGADAWRADWTPAPDAEQQYVASLDPELFPNGYRDDQAESLLAIGYSVCSSYYEGVAELDVYDRLADGEGGLPGPSPFELAEQAQTVTDAAYDNLCANVRPFGPGAVPTPTAGAEIVVPDPVVVAGVGDAVVRISKPSGPTSPVLLTISGNSAGQDFAVRAVDGEAELLVQTTAPYSGTQVVDAGGTRTTQLEVVATGPWSIRMADPLSAPPLQEGENTGAGDQVLRYEQGLLRGVLQVDGATEGGLFRVVAYTSTGVDQLVSSTRPYSGQVRVNGESALIAVTGRGEWSVLLR